MNPQSISSCSSDSEALLILLLLVTYFCVFFAKMKNPVFKDRFINWITMKDIFGIKFWSGDLRFSFFCIFLIIIAGIIFTTENNICGG